ncbi:MAG: GNAT family N-acetyltransferase [Bacteroidales bacterium]|nr:GNAT family N-acetyltransferase [Bacteroidales bacterium]
MNSKIFKKFPVLETERIIIRQMLKTDVNVVFDFNTCQDSLEFIIRKPFKTIDEAKDKLSFFLSGIENKTAFWWVFTLKETGEDIGYGGLFDISTENNKAEIGYGLIKKYWNKGYMSEIINAIIKFGISDAELHKIYGAVISGNQASIKLLEKNNFKKEAHLTEHSFINGNYKDETIYSLINN